MATNTNTNMQRTTNSRCWRVMTLSKRAKKLVESVSASVSALDDEDDDVLLLLLAAVVVVAVVGVEE
jgi:hypothetical protein